MSITIRKGRVVSVRFDELTITVKEDESQEDFEFHWTSFWSDFPGQRPKINSPVEIVCNGHPGRPHRLAIKLASGELVPKLFLKSKL